MTVNIPHLATDWNGRMAERRPRPRGLHGQVVQALGLAIARGDLGPDEQFVPEQIAGQFGVSRTVVREALRVLETKGMVAASPKTGTRVLPLEAWNVLDRDVITWRVQGPGRDTQLAELLDLRTAIEPLAARRCSELPGEKLSAQLNEICSRMEAAVADADQEAFTRADVAFHTTILSSSGSRILAQLTGAIEAVLRARESLHLMPEHVESAAAESHRRIVDAIVRGDGDAAETASRNLVQVAADEIAERLIGT